MSQLPVSPFLRAWYKWKMLRLPWRRQFLVGFDLSGNTYWEFLDRGSRLPPPRTNPSSQTTTTTTTTRSSPVRWRRIVRYPRGTHHSAVDVPPAWHQWLRHTRADPPSLDEQRAEVARQERIKRLAAEADARWEAKPRVMEDGAGAARRAAALGARAPALETDRPLGPGSTSSTSKFASAASERAAEAGDTSGAGTVTGDVAPGDSEAVNLREETWKRMKREAEAEAEAEAKAAEAEGDGASKAAGGKAPDPWRQHAKGGPGETWQPKSWEPTAREKK
ncbi:hypothetical protein MYCTH_2304985 [Thermothelomyces thermophilus ATCC 42464]|uniref:Uncharacterized protein n=1 Tax=Thermothelomyces thermophilus (strain ATCC 42464 / BCRC 31852 / DSM 1799) TaxID=573729 RepID=G2QBU4_THET4|nr:uncharacterized protein MYCTH_2304985 [Thermothelomyces thermophilus ATCC 42464]AEO58027.1 hypothetical protein MYCTH_2304985 [Thermothelomyces thermophilus ATCC 42464]